MDMLKTEGPWFKRKTNPFLFLSKETVYFMKIFSHYLLFCHFVLWISFFYASHTNTHARTHPLIYSLTHTLYKLLHWWRYVYINNSWIWATSNIDHYFWAARISSLYRCQVFDTKQVKVKKTKQKINKEMNTKLEEQRVKNKKQK